jgi:hypothetical protein
MSLQGPGGPGERDRGRGAQRWEIEHEQIEKSLRQDHLAHEAERIHAEEAAERGEVVKKRPWWKFWA